ncbi:MAG: L,D-transpeptidase [Acidimicrobiia bacterium]|nr:L,D-transpeptidase [Acidimicrobiia bacterium]
MSTTRRLLALVLAITTLVVLPAVTATASGTAAGVGVVDAATGIWYLRDPGAGETTSFYFGNPGDEPFMGDWNCDGVDTPGLYRRTDGYVYLRNSNSQGIADVAFYFGNPGDVPLAGDFDGDGCDSVSLYRPSEGTFHIIDRLGDGDAGLGAASLSFRFGDLGDQPIAGDFDGDGIDTVGVARDGVAYVRSDPGPTSTVAAVVFGAAGAAAITGSWTGDADMLAAQQPGAGGFSLLGADGGVIASFPYGHDSHRPIAGVFGVLPGGDAPPPDLPPSPNVGSGKRIIYSDSEQRVWLVEADGTLAKTHLVSGKDGIPAHGTYSVYSKSLNANSFNGITMTHMVRFAHGARLPYGFHSIPIYPNGQPMQTEAELGYYRSGGCVRQLYSDAVFLYDWAPIGTTVHVIP